MDPFRLCLALGPIAVYLLALAVLNLSRRPRLVSGFRDAVALFLALSGVAIVGPLSLLFPDTVVGPLRPLVSDVLVARLPGEYVKYVWVLLIGGCGLVVVLVLLALRPRLVVYNITSDQLRPILAEVVERLDSEARWAGDSLALPGLAVQLHLEGMPFMRNVSLVSAGPHQSEAGWGRLQAALRPALARTAVSPNPRGLTFLSLALVIGVALSWSVVRDPQAVATVMFDMLQWHP
jgi:hypothetical protein